MDKVLWLDNCLISNVTTIHKDIFNSFRDRLNVSLEAFVAAVAGLSETYNSWRTLATFRVQMNKHRVELLNIFLQIVHCISLL